MLSGIEPPTGHRFLIQTGHLCGRTLLLCVLSLSQSTIAESSGPRPVMGAHVLHGSSMTIAAPVEKAPSDSAISQLSSATNHLAISYARGLCVNKDAKMALRIFMSLAMDGYTPAMVNVGVLYESGLTGHRDRELAYAWVRAALTLGVPDEDVDATLYKLGYIAARLGSRKTAKAELAARRIALTVAEQMTHRNDPQFANKPIRASIARLRRDGL